MYRSKIVCLIFVSLLLESCTHRLLVQVKEQDYSNLPSIILLEETALKFKTELRVNDISLTGILIVKKRNEGDVLVTFMNEFGLKYFDAQLNGHQTTMLYCIKPLDKKLITNILLHDLSVLFIPSNNTGSKEGNHSLKYFTYRYTALDNNSRQVKEYNKKKLVSIYLQKSAKEYLITHPNIKIEVTLKLI